MNNHKDQLQSIAAQILEKSSVKPEYGIILGSGLGKLAESVTQATVIPYAEIPQFPVSTAPGHAGNLVIGQWGGKNVVVMQGRIHIYEGYSAQEVTYPVAIMKELGIHSVIVTCAAGGLNYNFSAGDLMLIRDHINFTGTNPLIGPNDETLGPRFPVMFDAYTPALRHKAHEIALQQGIRLHEGVYCGITGPVFFTPAELRMLMQWGCDAIGMSTVPEVIMAVHRGLKVLGIALISDIAIPDATQHHATSEEILSIVQKSSEKFSRLLVAILESL